MGVGGLTQPVVLVEGAVLLQPVGVVDVGLPVDADLVRRGLLRQRRARRQHQQRRRHRRRHARPPHRRPFPSAAASSSSSKEEWIGNGRTAGAVDRTKRSD